MSFEDERQTRSQQADDEERALWNQARETKRKLDAEMMGTQGLLGLTPMPRVAARYNSGKPQLHYADTFSEALDGIARVSHAGTASGKYPPYNYQLGAAGAMESYNASRRHMKAWLNGEDLVPDLPVEFNVHHIDAALWNLARLRQELVTFPERDDRPHKVRERQEQGK